MTNLEIKSNPKKVPLAWVSWIGVLSPEKYGKKIIPLDPIGDFSASLAKSINGFSAVISFTQVSLFGKVWPGHIGGKDLEGQKQTISLCLLKDLDNQLVADEPIEEI